MTFTKGIKEFMTEEADKPRTAEPIRTSPAAIPPPRSGPVIIPACSDMQGTINYKMFKQITSNREVDKAHVNKLVAAIRKKNLLSLNPIVVNENYEVIDGQHRLAAAEILKVPIFYLQDQKITQDDIAGMNSNKKNWSMMDYINFYAVKGYEDFVTFNKFCNKHRHLKLSLLQTLCSVDGKRNGMDLRDGKIDISNIDKAEILIDI